MNPFPDEPVYGEREVDAILRAHYQYHAKYKALFLRAADALWKLGDGRNYLELIAELRKAAQ